MIPTLCTRTLEGGWTFTFRSCPDAHSPFVDLSEEQLRASLNRHRTESQKIRLELLRRCRSAHRPTDALAIAGDYLEDGVTADQRCEIYFHLGQTMEGVQDWESAIRWYHAARECGTTSHTYMYFIHNNIGFSLNQLARFAESQDFLQSAIVIDASRANAYKNYGICLEGLGRPEDAARTYIEGVRADASDPRTLRHLEDLVSRHPELSATVPDLGTQLARCREAVACAVQEQRRSP